VKRRFELPEDPWPVHRLDKVCIHSNPPLSSTGVACGPHVKHNHNRTRLEHFSSLEAASKLASYKSNSKDARSRRPTSLSYKRGKTRFRMLRGGYGMRWCMVWMGGLIGSYPRRLIRVRVRMGTRVGVGVGVGVGVSVRLRLLGSVWRRLHIGSYLDHRFVRPLYAGTHAQVEFALTPRFPSHTDERTDLTSEPRPRDRIKTPTSNSLVEGPQW